MTDIIAVVRVICRFRDPGTASSHEIRYSKRARTCVYMSRSRPSHGSSRISSITTQWRAAEELSAGRWIVPGPFSAAAQLHNCGTKSVTGIRNQNLQVDQMSRLLRARSLCACQMTSYASHSRAEVLGHVVRRRMLGSRAPHAAITGVTSVDADMLQFYGLFFCNMINIIPSTPSTSTRFAGSHGPSFVSSYSAVSTSSSAPSDDIADAKKAGYIEGTTTAPITPIDDDFLGRQSNRWCPLA